MQNMHTIFSQNTFFQAASLLRHVVGMIIVRSVCCRLGQSSSNLVFYAQSTSTVI